MTERSEGAAPDQKMTGSPVPGPDEGDRFVSQALRTLPAPDHGPTFWTELSARLDAVDRGGDADRGEDAVPPLLAVTSLADRRRPDRRFLGVAAAVLLVAALVAGALTRPSDRRDDVEFADPPSSTTPLTDEPAVTAPSTETTSGDPTAEPATAGDAVVAFVTALAEGDGERAEALLGPATRAAMVDIGIVIEDLFEGLYAAWGVPDVPERLVSEQPLLSSGDGTLWAVVLRGNIGRVDEGPADGGFVTPFVAFDENNRGSFVVDIYPTGFDVEALQPELVRPAPGEAGLVPLAQGDPIEFLAPEADEAYVIIDDGDLQPAELVDGTWTYDPGTLDLGEVSVVVFTLGEGGLAYDAGITEVVPAD